MSRPAARITVALTLVALAAACAEEPKASESLTQDADNDGYAAADDCDDLNPAVHPGVQDELCNAIDDDCDGETDEVGALDGDAWFRDSDGDGWGESTDSVKACAQPAGYTDNPLDCDDTNAAVYPAGPESCDGVDNDCDGVTDEGTASDAQTWWEDADGDGYGSPWSWLDACAQPQGFVGNGADCNDLDQDVNPGLPEICSDPDVDEDCDELYDDEDSDISDQPTWYADSDGDTFGDAASTTLACDQPSGYVADDTDCDDTDATINPENAEECGNNLDDDCDGVADEEDAPFPIAWYYDFDSDGYGDPDSPADVRCSQASSTVPNATDCDDADADIHPGATETWYDGYDTDCDGLSDYDADVDGHDGIEWGGDDCDDAEPTAHPGQAEVCGDGIDNDCDAVADPCTIDATLLGVNAGDQAGGAVAGVGDWNADGISDIAVAADRYDGAGSGVGIVYVLVGPISGNLSLDRAALAMWFGENDRDRAGSSVAGLGDYDDDDYGDLAIGAVGEDTGGSEAGAVYVVGGPSTGSDPLSSADAKLIGEVAGDLAGYSVASAGDVDGDDVGDLVIGAYGQDAGGSSSGAAYVVLGPFTADEDLSYADWKLVGETAGDWAGFSVAGGGDLDGDGVVEAIVGAPFRDEDSAYLGGVYVVSGPITATTMGLDEADHTIAGEADGDLAGYSVAMLGDSNGDGYQDFAVGAPENDAGGATAGAAYIVAGGVGLDIADLGDADAVVIGTGEHEYLGCAVSGAGDVDADGAFDLVAGARLDDWSSSNAGAAYILLGPMVGTIEASDADGQVVGYAPGDWAGTAVAGAGDTNGDTVADILVGVPQDDTTDTNAGAAFLVRGGGW